MLLKCDGCNLFIKAVVQRWRWNAVSETRITIIWGIRRLLWKSMVEESSVFAIGSHSCGRFPYRLFRRTEEDRKSIHRTQRRKQRKGISRINAGKEMRNFGPPGIPSSCLHFQHQLHMRLPIWYEKLWISDGSADLYALAELKWSIGLQAVGCRLSGAFVTA